MALLRCDQCLNEKPIEEFPNISAGTICQQCMYGDKAAKTELALKAKAKQIAGQLASSSPEDMVGNIGSVRSIISDVYAEFGGTSGFASYLYYVITELSARKPMPAAVGQLLLNLMKLHHAIEQTEESINAREMTDEQLKREHEIAMMRIAMEAIGDPDKRKALDLMLQKAGLTISKASPEKIIEDVEAEVMVEVQQASDVPSDEELAKFLG